MSIEKEREGEGVKGLYVRDESVRGEGVCERVRE
jgi:hypothetical protein